MNIFLRRFTVHIYSLARRDKVGWREKKATKNGLLTHEKLTLTLEIKEISVIHITLRIRAPNGMGLSHPIPWDFLIDESSHGTSSYFFMDEYTQMSLLTIDTKKILFSLLSLIGTYRKLINYMSKMRQNRTFRFFRKKSKIRGKVRYECIFWCLVYRE